MTASHNTTHLALEDAVRALRDIAALDPERPAANAVEKVAIRALERIGKQMGADVASEGHTPRPGEIMFPPRRVRRDGAPYFTGTIGTEIRKP